MGWRMQDGASSGAGQMQPVRSRQAVQTRGSSASGPGAGLRERQA
ncbi:hypothetical protein [Paenibacillus sp. HGF7]|nr:hypothetical protein [Paenibacillus sp. HGF7]